MDKATFGGGCFWGIQHLFNKHFNLPSRVGYAFPKHGGEPIEAIEIQFHPESISYAKLVEFFYRIHDPTTLNQQGPDIGSKYRSAILYHTEIQRQTAERLTQEIGATRYAGKRIVTEIVEAGNFDEAEDKHQNYIESNPETPLCPAHFLRW
ncbi:uncharacterized protein VTP21DRAFT_3039 [Calcarisporiella thermophila]|uniref:uncharacterized protein n=1 Tax=Calcarisporiella thermophila TaxID=911321 RepID=UPI003742E00B